MAQELQRLLRLTAKQLRTGESRSTHDDSSGTWQSAIGLNAFLEADASRFLCATTAAPTRIGSTEITDIPIAAGSDPTLGFIYVLGSTGRFCSVDTNNNVNVIVPQTTVVLGTIANPTGSVHPVTDSGGNKYMFIAGRAILVRWDLSTLDSLTHWNTSNGLNSCNHHPMHKLFLNVYFGNGQYLGVIPLDQLHNQATTFTNVNFQLINFGSDQNVTAIGDDGRYTIVAISPNFDETETGTRESKIIWYPGIGINWEWEVTLKGERAVRQIVRNVLGSFAIGEKTIYKLTFGAQPELVRTFETTDSPGGAFNAIAQGVGPRVNLAAAYADSVIFGKRGATFGKRYPTEPVTFSHPLQGHTSDLSLVEPNFVPGRILVGTEDSKLWSFDMTAAGNTSNSYTTDWFDLTQRCTITRIEIEMPAGIAASDVLGITVEVPSGKTAAVSLSQATIASGSRTNPQLQLKPTLQGSQVRFTFAPSAGAPKHGAISIHGHPTRE